MDSAAVGVVLVRVDDHWQGENEGQGPQGDAEQHEDAGGEEGADVVEGAAAVEEEEGDCARD